ncbi:UPF0547 protein C16orf87 homolog isoform X4 [Canis lupus dingo]|uniref:UPF0547 protein C16orf87 homolog isoform X4 n=1 Tax=Canis lupus dingo TaxID=286419 RepID=UPI0020C51533|nr:UPF0547 protein C16orf87 homolog isoform X4 [Canis lupus dingo]
MSASRAKKVKMATKSCPECDQQVPVACKSCPCGYIFISRKLLNAKHPEKSPPSTETQRENERQRHRQREKQAPCREPDVGLDPGSPGSHPGLQAAPNRCTTGAAHELPFSVLSSSFSVILFIFLKLLRTSMRPRGGEQRELGERR